MPLALAMDFCRLPRWSIAAAAITPASLERFFRYLIFPGERLIDAPPPFSLAMARKPSRNAKARSATGIGPSGFLTRTQKGSGHLCPAASHDLGHLVLKM